MKKQLTAMVSLALCATTFIAHAEHKVLHAAPQGNAKVRFAPGFPHLNDHEWNFALGGFGGIRKRAPLRHVPVVFVHGNTSDHTDWYPVRNLFKEEGWSEQELWALAYDGLGGNGGGGPNPERDSEHLEMGSDFRGRTTNNEVNIGDLYDFIKAVQAYTGSTRFSIISHSLGVTVARRTLKAHPELRDDLVAFVGIAGGNHGTSLCPPGSEDKLYSCEEVAANTPWLDALNGPDGSDETYAPAKWLTVYDGTGALDDAFLGTYAKSPQLKGADNREFATHHNDLRLNAAIVKTYREFIESAEKPFLRPAKRPEVRGVRRTRSEALPATGIGGVPVAVAGGTLFLAGILALGLFLTRKRDA